MWDDDDDPFSQLSGAAAVLSDSQRRLDIFGDAIDEEDNDGEDNDGEDNDGEANDGEANDGEANDGDKKKKKKGKGRGKVRDRTATMDRISDEVLETERSYVNSLRMLISLYVRPLRQAEAHSGQGGAVPRLEAADLALIFGNIEQVLDVNEGFLKDLEEKIRHWSDLMDVSPHKAIAACFQRYAPFFRLYSAYAVNFMAAQRRIKELMSGSDARAKELRDFLLACDMASKTSLSALLIMPIQRIPRYELLLRELVKREPGDALLQQLFEDIQSVATHVNDSIRERENRAYVMEIQNSFRPPLALVAAHRLFMREGVLMLLRSHVRRQKARYFFLFSDLLVQCKRSGSNFHRAVLLNPVRVQRVAPRALEVCAIVSRERNDDAETSRLYTEPLLLEALTEEDCEGWVDDLQKVIDNPHIVAYNEKSGGGGGGRSRRSTLRSVFRPFASSSGGGGSGGGASSPRRNASGGGSSSSGGSGGGAPAAASGGAISSPASSLDLDAVKRLIALRPTEFEVSIAEQGELGLGLETGWNSDVQVKGASEGRGIYEVRRRLGASQSGGEGRGGGGNLCAFLVRS